MASEVKNFYSDNIIYHSQELQDSIAALEEKYLITEDFDTFKHHVNFSQNIQIPIHNWFKYREGYSHKLIDTLLDDSGLTQEEFVIDPFCGSGTTQLQANIHGISSFGVDINPMSVFVSLTKSSSIQNIDITKVTSYLPKILSCAPKNLIELSLYSDVERYFDQDKLIALLQLFEEITKISHENSRNFFKLCVLSIIELVSNRKRDGNGLATRPTKVKCVYEEFEAKAKSMLHDLHSIGDKTKGLDIEYGAISDNSENLHEHVKAFEKQSGKNPGAIIFSPPYANSFDYFESYKLELRLGGYSDTIKELKTYRNRAVRSFISDSSNREIKDYRLANLLADDIELSIPEKESLTGKKDSRTRKVPRMIKTYFNDMANIIEQCSLSLPKGKKCYIVVDQSSYLGKIVPSDLLLADLAGQRNFGVEKIVVCRKAKTSPQQAKRFPYLKEALRESIIVLVKK